MAESGIGTKAEKIKALVVTTLGTYDQRRFYPFLTNEVNPYKEDNGLNNVKDLRLDDVLQMRVERQLFPKRVKVDRNGAPMLDGKFNVVLEEVPNGGLAGEKFKDSKDLALAALQKNYTAAVNKYKADNGVFPKGEALEKLHRDFLKDDANKKLIEDLKITLLDDNKAKLTNRVKNADMNGRGADKAMIVGVNTSFFEPRAQANLKSFSLPPERTFFTPVHIGTTDPGDAGELNAAAFKTRYYRELYLDMKYDPATKKIEMGHDANEKVAVAYGLVVNNVGGRLPANKIYNAADVAAPGQFVPYEKLFEMAMDYYNGDTAKHKLLGGKEAKKKGDAIIEVVNVQVIDQKKLLDKQGDYYLKMSGMNKNTPFQDLQGPLNNFLDDISRFKTKKVGDKITLDRDAIDIKNPEVIKAIEDAFNEAQKDIDEKGAKEVTARKRALSQNVYLKELLRKHPPLTEAEAKARFAQLKRDNPGVADDELRKKLDNRSAKDIDALVKKHELDGLQWRFDVADSNDRATAEQKRDYMRQAAIGLFSEAYELERVTEDMKNLKEAIKNHYPLDFGMAAPGKNDALFAGFDPLNLREGLAGVGMPADALSQPSSLAAEAERLRLAMTDYSPSAEGEAKKPVPFRGKQASIA